MALTPKTEVAAQLPELNVRDVQTFLDNLIASKKITVMDANSNLVSLDLNAQDIVGLKNLQETLKSSPPKNPESILSKLNDTYQKLSVYNALSADVPDLTVLPNDAIKQLIMVHPGPDSKETKKSIDTAWDGLKNTMKGTASLTFNLSMAVLHALRDATESVFLAKKGLALANEKAQIKLMKVDPDSLSARDDTRSLSERQKDFNKKNLAYDEALSEYNTKSLRKFKSLDKAWDGLKTVIKGLGQILSIPISVGKDLARQAHGHYTRSQAYKAEMEKVKKEAAPSLASEPQRIELETKQPKDNEKIEISPSRTPQPK